MVVIKWRQLSRDGSIFALINRPQCIASLFVQIISHMFFGFSREPVSGVIIWKLEAQSLESHKVSFLRQPQLS